MACLFPVREPRGQLRGEWSSTKALHSGRRRANQGCNRRDDVCNERQSDHRGGPFARRVTVGLRNDRGGDIEPPFALALGTSRETLTLSGRLSGYCFC